MDIYEVVALAKRLNISFNEMKEITLITLINILISSVKDDTTKASQKDIDAFKALEEIAGIDAATYGLDMLKAGTIYNESRNYVYM